MEMQPAINSGSMAMQFRPLAVLLIELEAGELPLDNGGDTDELLDPQGNMMDRTGAGGTAAHRDEIHVGAQVS